MADDSLNGQNTDMSSISKLLSESDTAVLRSPQDYLEWIAERLDAANIYCGHGTDDVWDEAVHLLLHALGLQADATHEQLPEVVSKEQVKQIDDLLQKRIEERLPLPYLTHSAWFMQLPFYVDERVLIPRSPFASWIKQGFSPWISCPQNINRILDIGTGSGSLAICCALVFSEAKVDAVDISADALEVASKNIAHYQLSKRVHLLQSDCFSALEKAHRYDFIISNPPYVEETYWAELPEEYHHEPRLALHAAEKGLAICRQIMRQASDYLTDDGYLFIEVGYKQQALQNLYPDLAFCWLDCEAGGEGIFMLTRQQLDDYFRK